MTALAVTGGLWSLAMARFMFPNVLTDRQSIQSWRAKIISRPGQVETKFVSTYGV